MHKKYDITHSEKTEKTFMENCKMINIRNGQWLLKNEVNAVKLKLNRFAFKVNIRILKLFKTRGEYKRNFSFYSSHSFRNQSSLKMVEGCTHSKQHVDWRENNVVPPVFFQGDCGGCWAFSAASVLGSMNHIKNGEMIVYSSQELLDCVDSNLGCDGGTYMNAYHYVRFNGINPEKLYPYTAHNGICRHLKPTASTLHILEICEIETGDIDCLMSVVEKMGPISISIDSNNEDFDFYADGIYSCSTESKNVDHAMTIVGFYIGDTVDNSYYIVQNSHGTDWGIDGYMHLSMNKDHDCGASFFAVYPLVSKVNCHPDWV